MAAPGTERPKPSRAITAGRALVLAATVLAALSSPGVSWQLGPLGHQAFSAARPGQAVQRQVLRHVAAAEEPEVVDVGASFPVEEADETAALGAAAVSFAGGLITPLVGGFCFGLILAVVGFSAATGRLSRSAADLGHQESAEIFNEIGDLLLRAGSAAARAACFAAGNAARAARVAAEKVEEQLEELQ
mmetsp:Transcript_94466/g.305043  ORF Transcript_94466/g.305043 Transcript_94466/m.305043 type:complete len:189 (+) Transcript_94466:70-636(+)